MVEQGVSHLRDGQQRTPGVRFGICGTVGPIPATAAAATAAAAADDPTTWWWWWCGGWNKTLLLLLLLLLLLMHWLSTPVPMLMPAATPVPVAAVDGGVLQPNGRFPRYLTCTKLSFPRYRYTRALHRTKSWPEIWFLTLLREQELFFTNSIRIKNIGQLQKSHDLTSSSLLIKWSIVQLCLLYFLKVFSLENKIELDAIF